MPSKRPSKPRSARRWVEDTHKEGSKEVERGRERSREVKRGRERDRETERERQRQTDRHRHTQTHRHRHTQTRIQTCALPLSLRQAARASPKGQSSSVEETHLFLAAIFEMWLGQYLLPNPAVCFQHSLLTRIRHFPSPLPPPTSTTFSSRFRPHAPPSPPSKKKTNK